MTKQSHQTPTHAGAVVFRRTAERIEFLLVTARWNQVEWVLPKGHVEPGEDSATAARREVEEETGLLVEMLGPLTTVVFTTDSEAVSVAYYLGQADGNAQPVSPEGRRIAWMSERQAKAALVFPEARFVIEEAVGKLAAIDGGNGKLI